MFTPEYVAYKHIIEGEKQNLTKSSAQISQNLNKLHDCPRYLFPIKQKKIIERNLELNQASYTDDFILLSEFSEIEGPKPLFTIPSDGGCNFNKNDYSLHVMCVDFHTTHQPPQQQSTNNSRFNLSKDTSLINYWDLNSGGIAAYIHHFTLYDIEARGFVRPFCLAYITYDREKIQTYFNKFVQVFTKITNLFKKSNLNVFKRHLDEHMKNLYYTREKYLIWTNLTRPFNQTDNERVEQLAKYDIDQRADGKFSKFSLQTLNNLINEIESVLDTIKNELEVNNWYENDRPDNETINRLLNRNCDSKLDEKKINGSDVDRSSSCPVDTNEVVILQNGSSSKSKLILDLHGSISYSFNFNLNNSSKNLLHNKIMKNIYQLAPTTSRLAFKRLRLVHRFYSKSSELLKFNDLELKQRTTNNKSWYFLLGNCIVNDEANKIDIYRLNQYLLRRNTSYEELKYYSINDVSCNNIVFYSPNETKNDEDEFDNDNDDDFHDITTTFDPFDTSLQHQHQQYQPENDYDFVNSIIVNKNTVITPCLKLINEKLVELSEFNFDSILRMYLYKQFQTSFVHILYTLLKGRPIIVATRSKTSNTDKLNTIINCLYNFIPNNYSSSRNIVIYDGRPIKLIDLKMYKIIGLILNHPHDDMTCNDISYKFVPITIRNYISILDLDRQTFIGPKYNGTYLVHLCNKLKYFSNDTICYLYFLKGFNYFYLKLMHLLKYGSSSDTAATTTTTTCLDLCKKYFHNSVYVKNIDLCDLNIVNYLIKSFKIKQIYDYELKVQQQEQQEVTKQQQQQQVDASFDGSCRFIDINDGYNQQQQQQQHIEMPLIVDYEHLITFHA